MIGFGSIGRGTLPLILRHFKFDRSRMVVIDPNDQRLRALRGAGRPLRQGGGDARQLSRPADAASDEGRRAGLLRQPLGRHVVARHHAASAARSARSISTPSSSRGPGFYFDRTRRSGGAHQQRAPRHGARGEGEQSRRRDRRLLLRRQSRHGLVVRQAGADRPRRRARSTNSTSRASTIARAGRG